MPKLHKLTPLPSVSPKTWRALLAAAKEFAALKPWDFTCDCDAIGLIDPITGETRICNVLGNAGEVFAAVFYRRGGLRWILSMLSNDPDPDDLNNVDGMDCLKLEFVRKIELSKEDKAVLKAAAYEPEGKGASWPQFRSVEPGWYPWNITEIEASHLLADIPRLSAFCRMFEEHPDIFEARDATELAFLPNVLPDRPLTPNDLDWRPLIMPPEALKSFDPTADQLHKLRALKHDPELKCEFDCSVLPGASFIENGRPCFGRVSLLVETQRGLVLAVQVLSGALAPGEAFGRGFVEALLAAGTIPGRIFIGGSRYYSVLQPLCSELAIELQPASSLPVLEQAVDSLAEFLLAGSGPLKP